MDIAPVGNLQFAGEHVSVNYRGYMNGAVETGKEAADTIAELLKEQAKRRAKQAIGTSRLLDLDINLCPAGYMAL